MRLLRRGTRQVPYHCSFFAVCLSRALAQLLGGAATAGPGVTGKLGTITRSRRLDPGRLRWPSAVHLTADTPPGQANGINASGGVWHEATASGAAAPAASPSASSGGEGGY